MAASVKAVMASRAFRSLNPSAHLYWKFAACAVQPSSGGSSARCFHVWEWPYYRELYHRRHKAGPEPVKPRSAWLNWNYDVEIHCFGKRLSEDLSPDTLKRAFRHKSYQAALEEIMKESLGGDIQKTHTLSLHNEEFSVEGRNFASSVVEGFLRHELPQLPDKGIKSLHDFLMKEEKLAHLGNHLGVRDLILCKEFPVPDGYVAEAFLAVIGGLLQDQSEARAAKFVQDFIVTQLIGEDLDKIVKIDNPMGQLVKHLKSQGRGEPEPRLLDRYGENSVLACYHIGIYSDKQLIGKAAGETVTIAEEMAALDALLRIYGLADNRKPFDFSNKKPEDYLKIGRTQSNELRTSPAALGA